MNLVVAQCGGPTPVVNATLAAVVQQWRSLLGPGKVLGCRFGLNGLAQGDWVDLSGLAAGQLSVLAEQPGAALGGSRHRPPDEAFAAIAARLGGAGAGAAILIGGNGTMAAAHRLEQAVREAKLPLQVIGAPKTVDNDLAGCDVTPGYGSAARYLAYTVQEIGLDLRAMRGFDQVAIVEAMGRHSGWLAAATALARSQAADPPDLILLPEAPADIEAVIERIADVFARRQVCVVVVAEGVADSRGRYWAELMGAANMDPSGQRVFSMSAGASAYLVQEVQARLRLRCRQIKLNSAQRATRLLASPVDRELAAQVGAAAVQAVAEGQSGVAVMVRRRAAGWATVPVPFGEVIGRERPLPEEFIKAGAFDVTAACVEFIAPLIGSAPPRPLVWTEV